MSYYNKAVKIIDNIYWVGSSEQQNNTYLIINDNESILIDPGSMINFENIKNKIISIMDIKNIKYVIASHHDPDVCASIPSFEKLINRNDLEIITHSKNVFFIRQYGIKSNFYFIDKNNFQFKTKDLDFKFIITPYLHAPGAFGSYLINQKIFFSGDLFGAFKKKFKLYADENYFYDMEKFHKKYMPGKNILNYSLNRISNLEINMIAPQHGSIIKKEYVQPVIEKLKKLECGIYIEKNYVKSLIKEKEEEKNVSKKLRLILDSLKNIVVSTNGNELKYINKAFFRFSKYKDLKELKKYHSCICELFISREGEEYLKPYYDNGQTWIDVMLQNSKKRFFAVLKNKYDVNVVFEVSLEKIDKDEYLVSFYDISMYQENISFINALSDIQGVYFTIVTLDGKLKFISNSLLRELELKDFEAYKYSIEEFLSEEEYEKVVKNIKENNNYLYEIIIKYKNKVIPVLAYGYFMEINNEPLKIGILIDLREIKKLQEEAKKRDILIMQQAKMAQMGEMVKMIAHQWRQPLNAISAASIKLMMQCEINELNKKNCLETQKFIHNRCQELSKIIDIFVKYTDNIKENEIFKVSDAIQKVLEIMKSEFEYKKIKIDININEDFVVKGNKNILEQILINLLLNSKDAFMKRNKINRNINIAIENSTIKIIDNAGGIRKKYRDKIFLPYFTTKLESGTGLGLYLSKKFMQEYFNGDIYYEPLENGSKFVLNFEQKEVCDE